MCWDWAWERTARRTGSGREVVRAGGGPLWWVDAEGSLPGDGKPGGVPVVWVAAAGLVERLEADGLAAGEFELESGRLSGGGRRGFGEGGFGVEFGQSVGVESLLSVDEACGEVNQAAEEGDVIHAGEFAFVMG